MASLAEHKAYLQAEWQAAQAAPLSLRRALLVAALIDAYADRLFAATQEAEDVLMFRAELATTAPALGLVFELCAQRHDGPRLTIEAVSVPLSDYGALSVEDFMVSLYNGHTVQRVRLVLADGSHVLAHPVVGEAIEFIAAL